jgi:hypothetical protein
MDADWTSGIPDGRADEKAVCLAQGERAGISRFAP